MSWWTITALWAFGSPILAVAVGKMMNRADHHRELEERHRQLVEQRQHLKLVS